VCSSLINLAVLISLGLFKLRLKDFGGKIVNKKAEKWQRPCYQVVEGIF
jgi:hypothetical protein